MNDLPAVITHNYDPDRGPFQNLCSLADAEAQHVLDAIAASGMRAIKPSYLRRRPETEQWLLLERTRLLGPPRLMHPIYGFLGDFADGADPSRPVAALLSLAAFDANMLTFTISDSMTSLPLARLAELRPHRLSHHGVVFTLDGVREHVKRFGMPDPARADSPFADRFVEVQIWDDAPLRRSPPENAIVTLLSRDADQLTRSLRRATSII